MRKISARTVLKGSTWVFPISKEYIIQGSISFFYFYYTNRRRESLNLGRNGFKKKKKKNPNDWAEKEVLGRWMAFPWPLIDDLKGCMDIPWPLLLDESWSLFSCLHLLKRAFVHTPLTLGNVRSILWSFKWLWLAFDMACLGS